MQSNRGFDEHNNQNNVLSINDLPLEVLITLVGFLSNEDLARLAPVNKHFFSAVLAAFEHRSAQYFPSYPQTSNDENALQLFQRYLHDENFYLPPTSEDGPKKIEDKEERKFVANLFACAEANDLDGLKKLAEKKQFTLYKLLVFAINEQYYTPLLRVSELKYQSILNALWQEALERFFLQENGKYNLLAIAHGTYSPLNFAVHCNQKKAVIELIDIYKSDINQLSPRGKTVLYNAAFYNRFDIVELLLQKGAHPDPKSHSPLTLSPLLVATYAGSKEIVKLLCEYKADVNKKDHNHESAVDIAAEKNIDIVEVLIQHNANIDVKKRYSNATLLHLAILFDKFDLFKCLIEKKGADVHDAYYSISPLKLSVVSERTRMVKFLLHFQYDESDPEICMDLYSAYRLLGEHKKAVDCLTKAIELTEEKLNISNNVDIQAAHYKNLQRYYFIRQEAYTGLENFSEALMDTHKLIEIKEKTNKPDSLADSLESTIFFDMANLYNFQDEFEKAISAYNRALALAHLTEEQDLDLKIYTNRGLTYYHLGKFLEATDDLQTASQGGQVIGRMIMAIFYVSGINPVVPINTEKANELFTAISKKTITRQPNFRYEEKAAEEKNDVLSQLFLGICYKNGYLEAGVDLDKAKKFFTLASHLDFAKQQLAEIEVMLPNVKNENDIIALQHRLFSRFTLQNVNNNNVNDTLEERKAQFKF